MAHGAIVYVAVLVIVMAIYLVMAPMINGVVGAYNNQIDNGIVSEQSADSFGFSLTMWQNIPIFLLIGAALWLIVWAINTKEGAN